ncbi:MAG: glycosyltransferase family 2 protein [Parcubacteria group bacterium]|nr:glycosyltransferase family 2 protein [Parcubacteria group bacterium]
MTYSSYLRAGTALDIQNPGERRLYRFFEMLPGILAWGTLGGAALASWLFPVPTAFFIMAFVVYWTTRSLYLSFHLRSGYKKMKIHEKEDWLGKLEQLKDWRNLYHLIIVPTYLEPYQIVRESMQSFVQAAYPKDRFMVVLAVEGRGGEEELRKAELLRKEFQDSFFRFLIAVHPAGLPGEIAGKGANEAWAARKAREELIDPSRIPHEQIVVSSFDADTAVPNQFFACLAFHYLTCKDPGRTSFQPIPLFLNNIWQASPLSRIFSFSATFWMTINQERPEKLITFSSHSMSFRALVDVGYRLCNVVSDDSRIFWQCLLRYDGEYRVQPIFYPVYMDAITAPSFIRTLGAMYRQQRRWAYGASEIPYALFGFWKNRTIPFQKKFSLAMELIEGHWSWATAPILIFLLGWLPLLLGGPDFGQSLLSYNLPRFTSRVLTFGMVGLVFSAFLSINLLPQHKPNLGKFRLLLFFLQWAFMPVIMLFFSSFPALDAQTRLLFGKYMGFWTTPKYRKQR